MKTNIFRIRSSGLLLGLALCRCLASGQLAPASKPSEVIVVYNKNLPESKGVAEYYADKRGVPKAQLFGFSVTTNEEMSRLEFRDSLQKPLAKLLESQKLWRMASHIAPASSNQPSRLEWRVVESKIRYAVLCYGIPLRIAEDPSLKEEAAANARPELRRNVAAVESELSLLPMIDNHPQLAGPLRNWTYGATNTATLHPTNSILLVTRLDGPSSAIARGLVDKAIKAENEGLWGRAYFDIRSINEPGFKMGDDWIRGGAEICKRLGFETIVDENPATFPASFPMSQIGIYCGWYAEHACGPFAQPNVEFMPGAFAYHLHSFSASTIRSTTQRWVGPFLAKGATITMGSVDEPYLAGTPDVSLFLPRLIYQGFTFGEAAYACQSVLSWQTTCVGDPLYRPFGKTPELLHLQLTGKNNKLVEWSFLRLVNLNLATGKPIAEGVALLEQLDTTKKSAVLSEKLGDLYAQQGKPSSSVHAYEEALKLGPTPQQRIRLSLTLGEKLASLNQDKEAYECYQAFLRDTPGYPDKLAILQKLVPLARKLNHGPEADRFEAEIRSLAGTAKN
jgi:uncharacterized protein (TIGR03790 family)